MRIAIWHNLPSGGGKRALHDQVRGLVMRGHAVEIWCPSTANRTFLPVDGLAPEHVLPLRWRSVDSHSRLHESILWALVDRHRNLRALDAHCVDAAVQILRGRFDVLLAHGSAQMAVAPIARHVGIPCVLYLQEPERAIYEAMPDWPWIPPRLRDVRWSSLDSVLGYLGARTLLRYFTDLARMEQENIRAFDRVLANSLYSRESILRAHAVDSRVCHLGIDTDLFIDRGLPREGFALGVGSFTRSKNIDFVIQAIGCVREPRPPLVWIGNASVPGILDGLRRLAASMGVAFHPHENVSNDELVDHLNRASMMVYAPRLEPFGFAPLEANACALPVVAVAEGGVRETVVDGVNGLLVDPDPSSMAAAVERLRNDPALARRLGRAGRELVIGRWSQDAAMDRLEHALLEVASREST
jgi:glycosyltransferase involved in cell wall biosynthesis